MKYTVKYFAKKNFLAAAALKAIVLIMAIIGITYLINIIFSFNVNFADLEKASAKIRHYYSDSNNFTGIDLSGKYQKGMAFKFTVAPEEIRDTSFTYSYIGASRGESFGTAPLLKLIVCRKGSTYFSAMVPKSMRVSQIKKLTGIFVPLDEAENSYFENSNVINYKLDCDHDLIFDNVFMVLFAIASVILLIKTGIKISDEIRYKHERPFYSQIHMLNAGEEELDAELEAAVVKGRIIETKNYIINNKLLSAKIEKKEKDIYKFI